MSIFVTKRYAISYILENTILLGVVVKKFLNLRKEMPGFDTIKFSLSTLRCRFESVMSCLETSVKNAPSVESFHSRCIKWMMVN